MSKPWSREIIYTGGVYISVGIIYAIFLLFALLLKLSIKGHHINLIEKFRGIVLVFFPLK